MPWNVLLVADACGIAFFFLSYYFSCYKKGYFIDFWHMQMFLLCILPNFIMLPFARSELNATVLQQDTLAVIDAVPQVFLITTAGFVAFLFGGMVWRVRLGVGLRQAVEGAMEVIPHCSRMLMSSRTVLIVQSVVCLLCQGAMIATYFAHDGFGFDLRGYTFRNTSLRPVALGISTYSVVLASHSFARYLERRERPLLLCVVLLSFGLLFFGSRGNILGIFINTTICYLILLRRRVRLTKLIGITTMVVLTGLYLGRVRGGEYSPTVFFTMLVALIFYDNNFTDLRDFAWVYSKWNHEFWWGETYWAAILSFVPRFLSNFRNTWAIGVIVDTTVGLDPEVHPGLRPSAFGEGYFNFGLIGVVVVGLILGAATRRVDIDVKKYLSGPSPSITAAFASTMLLSVAANFSISGNFSGFYLLVIIYVISWGLLLFIRTLQTGAHREAAEHNRRT